MLALSSSNSPLNERTKAGYSLHETSTRKPSTGLFLTAALGAIHAGFSFYWAIGGPVVLDYSGWPARHFTRSVR